MSKTRSVSRRVQRGGTRHRWARGNAAPLDRSHHCGGKHPARHAEPGVPRDPGPGDRGAPVGQIVAGTKGIMPDRAVMRGTIGAFKASVRDHLVTRLGAFVAHIAMAYRAEAEMRLDGGSRPAAVNHAPETALVRGCASRDLGDEAVTEGRVVMASDDMSLFLRERPGCYFRVGIGPAGHGDRPHHAPEFEMNEAGLPVGLRVGLAVMRSTLGS